MELNNTVKIIFFILIQVCTYAGLLIYETRASKGGKK